MFVSDHGYWYGEHGLSVERRLAYDEALRIPLLVRYPPTIPAGHVVDKMALSIDLAPTVLELTGTKTSNPVDGRSLTPLLTAQTPIDWRNSFLVEYNTDTVFPRVFKMGYKAIRTTRWKYIRYNGLNGMDELYDLKADPYELRNTIDDPQAKPVLNRLQTELDTLLEPRR